MAFWGCYSKAAVWLGAFFAVVTVAIAGDASPEPSAVGRPRIVRPQLFEFGFSPNGAPKPAAHTTLTISYTGTPPTLPSSGAKVINNIQVQGVYLGPAFGTGKANAADVAYLDGFLSYIVGSPFMSSLSPYNVGTGTAAAGKVLPVTLPHYSSSNRTYLTDTQIQNLLVANIGSLIPPAANTLYVVYTEPGVAIDAGGGATSINTFLGYHSYASFKSGSVTKSFAYAVMPYPGSPNPSSSSQGFANARDELTSVTSHEIGEAATDPDTMNGWWETVIETDTYKNSKGQVISQRTYYDTGEEIGDVPLILFNWSSSCFVRLGSKTGFNGYLVQRMIGPDGKTMLSYPGSTAKAAGVIELATPSVLNATNQLIEPFGVGVP